MDNLLNKPNREENSFSNKKLIDNFNREYYYVRLSITEVCNFKCNYCLPDGYKKPKDRPQFLNVTEINNLVDAFSSLGCEKIRLTGGEPTLRRDFLEIVQTIKAYPNIKKLALTTNGYRMKRDVAAWFDCGVDAINVSVDSLDPRLFTSITGQDSLKDILAGIDLALSVGYRQIKVNSVLMKGLSDIGLNSFLAWIKHSPIQIRFIELMQTGFMDDFFHKYHLSGQDIEQKLLRDGWILKSRHVTDGPAKVYHHPDYVGEIGLIMPYSKDFCKGCNRLRISSLGKLHLCLFGDDGIDLRELLSSNSQNLALQQRISEALSYKKEHHFLHQGNSGATFNLSSLGG